MDILLNILEHNIVPIFILISLGFLLGKKFHLNVATLSKLIFYLFAPAFITVNLFTTDLHLNMLKILFFCVIYSVINDLIARFVSKIRKYDIGMTNALKNSIMFNNVGNIGLALITLVFSSGTFLIDGNTPYLEEALTVMIMILVYTNVTCNTLGFYYAGRATMNLKKSFGKIFAMPSIYVVIFTLLIKFVHFDLTATLLWPALVYLKNGLVSMALLSLGVQLSQTKFNFKNTDVHISAFIRLIVGPFLALIFIYLFGFTGVTAQTVLIAYSVPTAVNTALIAVETNNNPEFATQAVVVSTIFSLVTLSLAIYIAGIIFPI